MDPISLGSMVPSGVDAAAETPESFLLASKPLVVKTANATTAFYHIKDSDDYIQVSFSVAHPPVVSSVHVWFADGRFTEKPLIHSTHGGLILLSMTIHTKTSVFPEFYIYQPHAPSLRRVPQFMDRHLVGEPWAVGLLSHGSGGDYYVAVLTIEANGDFDLCLFCSKMGTWTIKKPLLLLEEGYGDDDFMPNKVITVGGGVLAFVDLTKGILIGDVLEDSPEFHYIPLPLEFCPPGTGYPLQTRDIRIYMPGDNTICIKFIDLFCPLTLGAWAASTWITTTAATSPWNQLTVWKCDRHAMLEARQLTLGAGVSIAELLPEASDSKRKPNFGYLFIDMPMLSLDKDNIVCFVAKHHCFDQKMWVIAVDVFMKKVLGVHPLQMGRFPTLFYSTISSHLNMSAAASGAKGDLEMLGTDPELNPCKNH